MRWLVLLAVLVPAPAAADDRWTANVELFGRGGIWGVGVEYELDQKFYVGGIGSAALLRGDQVYQAGWYAGLRLLGTRHVWRADLGASLVHVRTPSPVPEWDGAQHTGSSMVLSTGYEYRGRLRWRAGVLVLAGEGGIAPWAVLSVGLPF